jgi:hypothetical protein
MNTLMLTADRATHLKIVVIALLAATLVVLVTVLARGLAAPFMIHAVVKASSITGQGDTLSILPALISRVH